MPDTDTDKVHDQCAATDCLKPSVESDLCEQHLLAHKVRSRRLRCLLGHKLYAMKMLTEPAFVKFGIAGKVRHRRANMQTGSPFAIQILGSFRGTHSEERAIHKLLSEYRVLGEWFRYEGKAKIIADYFASSDWDAINKLLLESGGNTVLSFEERLAAIAG